MSDTTYTVHMHMHVLGGSTPIATGFSAEAAEKLRAESTAAVERSGRTTTSFSVSPDQ